MDSLQKAGTILDGTRQSLLSTAMAVMSFPLLVRDARIAFEAVNPRLEQVATTLGASPFRVFLTVTFPLAIRGIIAGSVLAFARALG